VDWFQLAQSRCNVAGLYVLDNGLVGSKTGTGLYLVNKVSSVTSTLQKSK